jgi:hypothetical protein
MASTPSAATDKGVIRRNDGSRHASTLGSGETRFFTGAQSDTHYQWQRFAYRYLGPGLRYIVLIALALLFLFPFYLMIRTA